MIGRFTLDAPAIDDQLSQMVESHRMTTGQDYGAILFFGLWGTADCSPEVRLYAAYQHLAANPEDGPAWLETARAHAEAGEVDKAEAILDELQRLDCPNLYPNLYSEDPDVYRAMLFADSGRLDAALGMMDELRSRHSDSPVYHYALASILQGKGDFPAAVAAYEESQEMLDDFRREVEEEDMGDDVQVDFPAATEFIRLAMESAKREQLFEGERPLDLSGFVAAIEL